MLVNGLFTIYQEKTLVHFSRRECLDIHLLSRLAEWALFIRLEYPAAAPFR